MSPRRWGGPAVATAAAAGPHEVVVYVLCGAGTGGRERVEAELSSPAGPAWRAEPLSDRAAAGPPAEVAATIGSFARAGATTVVLQPAADDPDVAVTIRLAADARTVLRSRADPGVAGTRGSGQGKGS